MSHAASNTPAGANRDWRHHPDLPVITSPLFDWPPRPLAALRWFARSWLRPSEHLFYVVLALVVWTWLQPPPVVTTALAPGWVAALWLRNLVLFAAFAGGLHLWLYVWRGQGEALRFARRDPQGTGRAFSFGAQVRDNMFWSLTSGVALWTAYEAGLWLAYANGIAPTVTLAENPVWFLLWFPLIPVVSGFHFYWVHHALHWPPLYRLAHALHHRNVAVGPWSGFSMHPVEHVIYLSAILIHLVVPSHPLHMLFHMYWLTLATATSHSGFEALQLGNWGRIAIGSFYHQLHHRYFECNYGSMEMPWDRWFGTYHDGTAAATAEAGARMRRYRVARHDG